MRPASSLLRKMPAAPSPTARSKGISPSALRQLAGAQPLPIRVVGRSMEPKLRDGDVVTVVPSRFYFPGDVIAFRQVRSGKMLVHRFLGYRRIDSRWALLVQGDTCSSHDGAVFPDQVIGKARAFDGDMGPLEVSLADRTRALGRWWRLALAWFARNVP